MSTCALSIRLGTSLSAIGRRLGGSVGMVSKRILCGWTVEDAISTPRITCALSLRVGTPLSAISRKLGGNANLVWFRVNRGGWDVEDAISVPKMTDYQRGFPPSLESNTDLRDDILAGENSARTLAARYDLSERTIVRNRKRLRAQGYRVRVPE